jgi:hypothetical protein
MAPHDADAHAPFHASDIRAHQDIREQGQWQLKAPQPAKYLTVEAVYVEGVGCDLGEEQRARIKPAAAIR